MRSPMNRVITALRSVGACVLGMAIAACGGAPTVQKPEQNTIGAVTSATLHSAHTGALYTIYVYLPASYSTGTTTYPVIYATDGDAGFPPDGRFVNFVDILQRHRTDAILVGIGGTKRRSTDFVLPGAIAYHEFLTQELIPFVESHFRADPKRRILSGISLGGSFVVTALFLEAPRTLFFSYYISAEGYFRQPSFAALERELSRTIGDRSIPATLILARGSPGGTHRLQSFGVNGNNSIAAAVDLARGSSGGTNSADVNALYRRMTDRHYADLTLVETQFDTDHVGTDNPSFEDAMARFFK